MKRYPIGIQDFEKLRTEEFLYIDKTRDISNLILSGSYYFLSRPRRFGKSLLLSALKYFFLGRRDLFQGLRIDREGVHDWAEHPVLHFSFNTISYKDLGLEAALHQAIDLAATSHEIKLTRQGLAQRFEELLTQLGSGTRKVVLLIDEYDKPIIDYIDDIPKADANRETLKNFFSIIKNADPFLRFFFITGVSKFSKVSLFSDLNHLSDITTHPRYATLTGYTPEEMDTYFGDVYPELGEANGFSVEEVRSEIQRWYNGYQWSIGKPVYNPFSVLLLFDSLKFENKWWDTGTPTFLLKILKNRQVYDFSAVETGNSVFDSYTLHNLSWESLMFQTGYLTIHAYDAENRIFTLGYPNFEVKDSMLQYLLAEFRHGAHTESQVLYGSIRKALDAGDIDKFIALINTVFATIPYEIFIANREAFFHAVMHLTFQGVGLLTRSEVSASHGRADCVVHSRSGIYVMEFKLDDTAASAMKQIRDKQYVQPYLGQGKAVAAIGISFSSQTKAVAEWEVEKF
jgi:hypothetical protein